jgi:hypothetical protein
MVARVEAIEYYRIGKETRTELNRLKRSLESGSDATDAIRFVRYLQWSGLLAILKRAPDCGRLTCDGALIEWEASELLEFALRLPQIKRVGTFEERVLNGLDVIAGHVAKFTASPALPQSSKDGDASTVGGAVC